MIHILIGTRAQLIKMVPLMHLMKSRGILYNFIFMAQHHDTIREILDEFDLKHPDHVVCDDGVDIVRTGQMIYWSLRVLKHGFVSGRKLFNNDKKGIVLVHGDAPPVLLGALLAKAQGLSVGVVEAGLRSFNFLKPFPEELTRVLVGKMGLADVFFCQDGSSMRNVEKYRGRRVFTKGNTIIDAIQLAKFLNQDVVREEREKKNYAIATVHRFESLSSRDRFTKIVDLIVDAASRLEIRFILHPPTREKLHQYGLYERLDKHPDILLLPRAGFLEFNAILMGAEFLITDGGSNQEEAAFLGIPCLLFRTETERGDGIGRNVLLSNLDREVVEDFIDNYESYRRQPREIVDSPSEIILSETLKYSDC